jgi:hypothetical protein
MLASYTILSQIMTEVNDALPDFLLRVLHLPACLVS